MVQSFAIDADGDMYLTGSGDIAMLSDATAVGQNCVTAMRAQKGEMQYAMQDGMPTAATAFDRYDPIAFEAAARKVLSKVAGVVSLAAFNVARVQNNLQYSASIRTVYGPTTIQSVL